MDYFLKSKFKYISLGLAIICIVMVVMSYLNNRSYRDSFERKFGSGSSGAIKISQGTDVVLQDTPAPLKSPIREQKKEISKAKSGELAKSWKRESEALVAAGKRCEAALQNILPDNSLIDVNDPFYDNPDAVIAKYSELLQEAVTIDLVAGPASVFDEIVMSDDSVKLNRLLEMEASFDICRSQRALVFVETVFEAFSQKMWAPLKRGDLMRLTLGYLQNRIQQYPPSAQNITFSLNLLLGLSVQGLLPKEIQTEIDDLYDKVIESQDLDRELPKMDKSEPVKRELFRDNYANNKYISGEIFELLKRLGQRY